MNRRNFLKKSAVVGGATLLIPEIVNAVIPNNLSANESQHSLLSKGETILLQGDSITDAGRKREDEDSANKQSMFGSGYSLFIGAGLLAKHPDLDLKVYNRGISGNKVYQLAERWEKDCLSLKPNVLSILIGVNDYWHTLSGGYNGTISKYITDYNSLLERTQKELPGIKIVICEPFIIHGGTALNDTWEPAFAGYRDAAKNLAKSARATFVPFQSVFNEALKKAPASYWGPDGVHPSLAGAQLMADAWMKAIKS